MRTILLILLFISTRTSGQEITLKVSGIQDSVAYLGYHFADKRFVADTLTVRNETVVANGDYKPGMYFLYTPTVYFEFIVNEPVIELQTSGPNYAENLEVVRSEENKVLKEMQMYISGSRSEVSALKQELDASGDSTKRTEITARIQATDQSVKDFQRALIQQNPGTFVSKLVAAMMRPEIPESLLGQGDGRESERYLYYKSHFFDGISVADPDLIRTPVLHQKVNEYLDRVIFQEPDSVIKEVDWLIDEAAGEEEVYRYYLVTLSNKYETSPIMGHDEVFVHIVEKYYLTGTADWVDQELLNKLQERIATMKPNFIGNPAPRLVLTDTLSSPHSLYNVKADYTVLYFYDPDCGHCKKKTPELYEAYQQMQPEVEVLAINITTNHERWREYIRDNDLQWLNLMDEKGTSNFRYYYDVRSTPTIYILDKDKKIIAKKIDASQVQDFIDRHRKIQEL